MADDRDDSQRTEEPTQKKLDDARKKGQVIQSREVSNWLMLLAVSIVVIALAPGFMGSMGKKLTTFIEQPHLYRIDAPGALEGLQASFLDLLLPIGVPMGLLLIAALASSVLQHGFMFSTESLKPQLDRLSPMAGFHRIFSVRSFVEFIKNLLKLAVISGAGVFAVMPEMDTIERLISKNPQATVDELAAIVTRLLIAVCAVLAAIAVLDYLYQRIQFLREMRMTREEIREEYKQTEGDPHVKARIRQLRQERARRRMMAAVPNADVVITNPTHFAVALKYDQAKMNAPTLVAKGADLVAHRIREVARENEVPIVENPPLARALHAGVELDQEIPAEHYRAVAEIIGYVWRLKGRMSGHDQH